MPDQTAATMRPMTAEETRQALDFETRVRREFSVKMAYDASNFGTPIDEVLAVARKIEEFLKNG